MSRGLALRIVLGDVFQVTAHEDQAAGTELAFAGSDAGFCALNLAVKCCFSEGAGLRAALFFFTFSSWTKAS